MGNSQRIPWGEDDLEEKIVTYYGGAAIKDDAPVVPLIESTHLPRFFHLLLGLQSTPVLKLSVSHSLSVSTEEKNTFNSDFMIAQMSRQGGTWKVLQSTVSWSFCLGYHVSNEDRLTDLSNECHDTDILTPHFMRTWAMKL